MKFLLMKRSLFIIFATIISLHICAAVNDTFFQDGIQYKVIKEDVSKQSFEVSTIHYDTTYVILPDSIRYGEYTYAITDAVLWYSPSTCSLRHYKKIDLSHAKHIISLPRQISGLIAIDTLILPPNLYSLPSDFYTSDSTRWSNKLFDEDNLLPGIHRIFSSGTDAIEYIKINNCTSLLEIDLSTYTTTFANRVSPSCFVENRFLKKIILPNTIKCIPDHAFGNDIRLEYISMPDSLKKIGINVAEDIQMKELHIGKYVEEIMPGFATGWYALQYIEVDTNNTHFSSDKGVLYTKDKSCLLRYPYSREDSVYSIPIRTTSIGTEAFSYGKLFAEGGESEYLKKVMERADGAFLKNLICNPALQIIGSYAFRASSIKNIINFEETQVTEIPSSCFWQSSIEYISLPSSLKIIGNRAFAQTPLLQTLEMYRLTNLEFIGEDAFRDATKLRQVNLLNCNKLITIPKNLCKNDSSLEYLSLPRNVISIGNNAFENCYSLKQIICPADTPINIDESVFAGVDKQNCKLIVPARSLELYKKADIWKEFFSIESDNLFYLATGVSDTLAGIVTGGGAYIYGERAILEAVPNEGYEFVCWNDGNTDIVRSLTITQDDSLTAIFNKLYIEPAPIYYSLYIDVNDYAMGQVIGNGEYEEGTQVTLTAVPSEGYRLQSWSCTNSTDESIIFIMPAEDASVFVTFEPIMADLETTSSSPNTHKIILKNGKILINHDGKIYTILGIEEPDSK